MFGPPRIKTNQLARMCRRVGTSLGAGVEARTVWARESERGPATHRKKIARIRRAVDAGQSVADAMADTKGFFPPLVCEMVALGEATGHLDTVMLQLADHYDHRLTLRRTFLIGIIWPMIELVLAVIVVAILIAVTGYIGQQTGHTFDMLGLGLVGTRGLVIYFSVIAGVAVLIYLTIVGASRNWFWTRPLTGAARRIPGVGHALKTLALSRMAWTLTMTIESGMDACCAVDLSLKSTDHPRFTRHAEQIGREITQGSPIHEALRHTGDYPDEFLDALQVGEESGRMAESMVTLAGQYRARARAALGVVTIFAGLAVFALVAVLIGAVIIRMYMSYINMLQNAAEGNFPF